MLFRSKLNEWPAHAHGMMAQLCERLGELDAALQSAEIAFQRDPTRKTAYTWLEQSCLKAGRTADAERYRLLRERLERALPETQPSSSASSAVDQKTPAATAPPDGAGSRGQP